jgi:hypothetical protein
MDPLLIALKRIRRRLLLVRAAEAGMAGALGAAILAILVTALRIVLPSYVPAASAHPALPLAFLPVGFVLAMLARLAIGVSLRQAAIAADHVAGLMERLTTALEVLEAPPDRRPPGVLDDRLLDQARAAAAGLDPSRLPLARTAGRSAKVLAVAVLALAAGALVPPVGHMARMGDPVLSPKTAARAAEVLQESSEAPALAPAVRAAVERAVRTLQEPGARQAGADEATAGVLAAARRARESRQASLEALENIASPDIREIVRQAAKGDADGARSAAEKAAANLAAGGAGGAAEAERGRIAAGLSGAAQVARREDLPRLAAELEAAAEAVRRRSTQRLSTGGDPQAAGAALERLAEKMTETLGPSAAADLVSVEVAAAQVRSAMGLGESPSGVSALPPSHALAGKPFGVTQDRPPVAPAAPATGSPGASGIPAEAQAPAAMPPIPPDLSPEDRQVVRRYFGG